MYIFLKYRLLKLESLPTVSLASNTPAGSCMGTLVVRRSQMTLSDQWLCFLDMWEVKYAFAVNTLLQATWYPSAMCAFKCATNCLHWCSQSKMVHFSGVKVTSWVTVYCCGVDWSVTSRLHSLKTFVYNLLQHIYLLSTNVTRIHLW